MEGGEWKWGDLHWVQLQIDAVAHLPEHDGHQRRVLEVELRCVEKVSELQTIAKMVRNLIKVWKASKTTPKTLIELWKIGKNHTH